MANSPNRKRTRGPGEHGPLSYHTGFGNYLSSEVLPGALPSPHNTPQVCPYGLYAELLSGTSFTKVKHLSQKVWFYRIFPSAAGHGPWVKLDQSKYKLTLKPHIATPAQRRWKPIPMPAVEQPTTFIEGLVCYMGAGDPKSKAGIRIYLYACNKSMEDASLCNSDGDFLIVPEHGTLTITTEHGVMEIPSGHIGVVQRGIKFSVAVPSGSEGGARGYVCEVFDGNFQLPPMGVIGTNGLANTRDFEFPTAHYEDRACNWTCYQKFCGELWSYQSDHSPFDVVAWHGNYVPYRYDLAKFCAVNSVTYDHLDPSIFCVLTAQTAEAGPFTK